MKPHTRRALACLGWAAVLLLAAMSASEAQRSGAGPCRQGLLALMVMIDAEEQDKSLYQNTAREVVETCGAPSAAKKAAASPAPAFDKDQCGKLALAMLDTIEEGKLEGPQFAQIRNDFSAKCMR